jgi:hypothetical protein
LTKAKVAALLYPQCCDALSLLLWCGYDMSSKTGWLQQQCNLIYSRRVRKLYSVVLFVFRQIDNIFTLLWPTWLRHSRMHMGLLYQTTYKPCISRRKNNYLFVSTLYLTQIAAAMGRFSTFQYSVCFSTFQYVSVRFITFQYVSVRFNTFQYVSVRFSTFHYVSLRFSTFQYVSVRFSTFQYVSVRYSTFQYVSVRFSTFQYVSVCFSTFQYVSVRFSTFQYVSERFSTFQYVSVRFGTFQYVSVRFSTFQHSSALFNTFQHFSTLFSICKWCGWKSAEMVLLRMCLESIKNYFHLWGTPKITCAVASGLKKGAKFEYVVIYHCLEILYAL